MVLSQFSDLYCEISLGYFPLKSSCILQKKKKVYIINLKFIVCIKNKLKKI